MEVLAILLSCKSTSHSRAIVLLLLAIYLCRCAGRVGGPTVTISPVGAVTVVEGNNLTITCTDGTSSGSTLRLREDGVELTGSNIPLNTVSGLMRTFVLPVDRTRNGTTYDCFSGTTLMSSEVITLIAACKWISRTQTHKRPLLTPPRKSGTFADCVSGGRL